MRATSEVCAEETRHACSHKISGGQILRDLWVVIFNPTSKKASDSTKMKEPSGEILVQTIKTPPAPNHKISDTR